MICARIFMATVWGMSFHKVRSIKKWFSQFGVLELDGPGWTLDLKPQYGQRYLDLCKYVFV